MNHCSESLCMAGFIIRRIPYTVIIAMMQQRSLKYSYAASIQIKAAPRKQIKHWWYHIVPTWNTLLTLLSTINHIMCSQSFLFLLFLLSLSTVLHLALVSLTTRSCPLCWQCSKHSTLWGSFWRWVNGTLSQQRMRTCYSQHHHSPR